MATTIDYLNQVHGDLLDAAKREGSHAGRRPPSRWVPSTGLVAAVVGVLLVGGADRPDRTVGRVRVRRCRRNGIGGRIDGRNGCDGFDAVMLSPKRPRPPRTTTTASKAGADVLRLARRSRA